MWKSTRSNENIITPLTKRLLPKSVISFSGCLIIIFFFALSGYSIQILFYSLITLCALLIFLLIHREKKISTDILQFRNFLESSLYPIQVLDRDGITRYVNTAFINWSKMDRLSLIGKDILTLMKNVGEKQTENNLWSLAKPDLASGKTWIGDVEFVRPDGQIVLSTVILLPIRDAYGKLFECIAQHNDLTERNEFTRIICETQKQYRSIVETSPDGIVIIQDGRLEYVNPSAVHLFGYSSAEEMKAVNFKDIIALPGRHSFSIGHEGHVIGEEILRNYEMRGLTKPKKIIDLEANAHIIEWNSRPAVQASFRDITERKMLERDQALWLWEQETLSEIDRKLVGIMNLEEIFSAILQQTLNLTRAHFGGVLLVNELYKQAQWKAIRGNSLQHSLEPFSINETLTAILKNEEPLIINDSNNDSSSQLSKIPIIGEEKLISIAFIPLHLDGKKQGMLAVGYRQFHNYGGREMRLLISLAEKHSIAMVNARLYTDLLQREKELEVLSVARLQAQEDERRRIAREIHDGLGQMLTAIKFNLEILEDMITIVPDVRERIDDMKGLLDSVMKEAREISYNLMPSVLEDFGLAPALQLLSEQFSNRTNIKVQFHAHDLVERLDPQMEIGLYRIVQESLNNVAKHAEASEVNLQIIHHAGNVRLVIEDNGMGFVLKPNIERAINKSGLGLVSMRERASSFGGIFTIDSTPSNGTLITVEIPILKLDAHE